MTKKLPNLNPNQVAILIVLVDGEAGAQQIAKAGYVSVGQTAIYNSLRALRDRGLVIEKKVKRGATPKGDRYNYRLSAKGNRLLGV